MPHLFFTAHLAHMDMESARARHRLPEEMKIGRVGIGREQIPEAFKRGNKGLWESHVANRDLDIDDRLRGKAGDRGGADVIDLESIVAKRISNRGSFAFEIVRPLLLVVNDPDRRIKPVIEAGMAC